MNDKYVDILGVRHHRAQKKRMEWTLDYADRIMRLALKKNPNLNKQDLFKWAIEEAYKRFEERGKNE